MIGRSIRDQTEFSVVEGAVRRAVRNETEGNEAIVAGRAAVRRRAALDGPGRLDNDIDMCR